MNITQALNEAENWLTHQEHLAIQEVARTRAVLLEREGKHHEALAIQKQLENTRQTFDPISLPEVVRALVDEILGDDDA